MKQEIIPVTGMDCASCALNIGKILKKLPGIEEINVNFATEKAALTYDEKKVNIMDMNTKLQPFGYQLQFTPQKENKFSQIWIFPLSVLVFVWMLWNIFFPGLIPMMLENWLMFILASIVLFTVGRQFIRAVGNLFRLGKSNMDTLIGVGTLVAYIYSTAILLFSSGTMYFDVVIVVIGFILFGKYLEKSSKQRTGEALQKLMKIQAKTAIVLRNGVETEVQINDVQVDDEIVVKPGTKIPVDGKIIEGFTSIDEALITGESIPVDKNPGDLVIGGTMNQQGAIVFRANRVGEHTFLAQILQMVESAQGSKAPIERIADQVSSIFVPTILVVAVLTFVGWLLMGSLPMALTAFVGVLVIACPCALGLATPTAIIVGVGRGAGLGILIKNAESLEGLHKVTTVVLDKTGTLTTGKPQVTNISGTDAQLTILASLEKKSEHPLAQAIIEKASAKKLTLLPVAKFLAIPGKGIQGQIEKKNYLAGNLAFMNEHKIKVPDNNKGAVYLSDGKKLLATVKIEDIVKDNAKETVAKLHQLGIKVVMLTGDDINTASSIANRLGIDQVIANVLPGEKANKIAELKNQGEVVAMVGDGVNDAPALAAADLSIAMSTGTDAAISTSQITLLAGDISRVVTAISLSKKTMRTIKLNLFWAFAYNAILVPVAALGLLNPMWASLAMAFSSVSVVGNSLLLKKARI